MTVFPAVPKVTIGVAAGSARMPSEAPKACVFAACSTSGAPATPEAHASGARAAASFGLGKLPQMVYTHNALDPNRTPVLCVRLPSTNAGVLHLDTSDVTGEATISPDSVVTPLGYYEPYFEVLTGGTVGTDTTIKIRRSADEARHFDDIELGTSSVLEISDTGIKIVFSVNEANLVALANDIRQQYIDHIANTGGVWHTAADATNQVAHAAATTTATAITLLNELRTDYAAHRILTAGTVHAFADSVNVVSVSAATDGFTAVTLANALKVAFNGHRTQATIHALNDTVNIVSVDDATAATLNTGDIITGWTDPPRCTPSSDFAALFNALKATSSAFSMICFGEPIYPADAGALQAGLTLLEQYGRDVQAIFTVRPRYKPTLELTVGTTFADANPDTMVRSTGSWMTDGVKVGMRALVDGTASNDGTFARVAIVTALTLTFTSGAGFVAEGPVSATLLFEETEADYDTNIDTEWRAVNDVRLSPTAAETRVDVPGPRFLTLDKPWPEELASKLITSGIDVEPGQVRKAGVVGGALAVALSARIYEGSEQIHYDADADPLLASLARMTVLRRLPDGRSGAFVNTGLTLAGPNDAEDTIVKRRLSNEWKRIVRSALTDEILSGLFADQQDPNRLSEGACQDIESRVIPAMATSFNGKISNVNLPPPNAIFTVDRESDLSAGIISCLGKIITKFYPRGFDVTLTVTQPGQV